MFLSVYCLNVSQGCAEFFRTCKMFIVFCDEIRVLYIVKIDKALNINILNVLYMRIRC